MEQLIDLALQVLSEFLSSDEVIALDHDEFDIRDDVLRALDNLLESRTFFLYSFCFVCHWLVA